MIDYSDILKALVRDQIDFTVMGGFAVVAHGIIRVTMDLDLSIVLDPINLHIDQYSLKREN